MEMKMLTGLGGPDYSLSKGDTRDFSDGEALRLHAASFAVPVDQEAFAELQAKAEAESEATQGTGGDETKDDNPDADLDAAKTHAQIDEIAANDEVTFADDVTTVKAKIEAVRDSRLKAREEAAKAAEQE